MRLAGLLIKNFKRVGDHECAIRIDEIVVLIGQNNAGKSTVLDAYEAFASTGKALEESHFHNGDTSKPVEITGVFDQLTPEDEVMIGKKWTLTDANFGDCVKVRWIWKKPNEKGQKQSYNPVASQFEDGGVGGWDSLFQSRIPQPVRLRPTDPIEQTQIKIVGMLKDHVKMRLKADSSSTKEVVAQIELLAQKLFDESKSVFDDVAAKITSNVSQIFPGTTIELVPRSKDAIDEKVVGAESYLKIGTTGGGTTPLLLQGTGIQRALLWSALSVMSDSTGSKKKAGDTAAASRILLIDEPEAFLHPPTIRGAREALYNFALNNPDWQVIATTHSPIFIDLSKDHTTIVRVDASSSEQRYVSTDKFSFDEPERQRLQMVRRCHPVVNEFFFYDNIVLVEGPTEHIAIKHVAEKNGIDIHVIDCLGKANIPLFAAILNQFKVPYLVIHDSDTPKVKRKSKIIGAAMWTMNQSIRSIVSQSNGGAIFTQFPHFEGEFLGEDLSGGKVDRVLEFLSDSTTPEYSTVCDTYAKALARDPSVLTTDAASFDTKRDAYVAKNSLTGDAYWL
ncbi:ATP-dependent nuclease [Acidovorax radicis]|uniref:ATP-dependent nuclease n=1 Tax=Acidovorax radicis TaxID=758826 RepID=UPI00023758DF|nr:AAA family ATPase [Acidovorax radicis]